MNSVVTIQASTGGGAGDVTNPTLRTSKEPNAKLTDKESSLLSKKAIALKLLTNRRVRQGAIEFLKDPRADKKTLAVKLLSNHKMRQGAIELLRDPDIRGMLLQQTAQRFRRP